MEAARKVQEEATAAIIAASIPNHIHVRENDENDDLMMNGESMYQICRSSLPDQQSNTKSINFFFLSLLSTRRRSGNEQLDGNSETRRGSRNGRVEEKRPARTAQGKRFVLI